MLHPRLIVTTLFCTLFLGIAHGEDHSASSRLIEPVAGPSEDISATHEDFSCATGVEVTDDVMTVRTTLAGVPAIVRVLSLTGSTDTFRHASAMVKRTTGPARVD